MYILEECPQFGHIVSWTEDGLSFIIHDADKFEETVLPHIFKDAMFNSFLRKVGGHLTYYELYLCVRKFFAFLTYLLHVD